MTTLEQWFDFLKIFGPSVMLPIIILWLTDRQGRKIKKLETDFEISKIFETKKLESKFSTDAEKKEHEKVVHASLIKILFEVQTLHIALSGNCVDFKCIEDATKNFKDAFTKYQSIISDNQIYLSSHVTNSLYKFYKTLGQLMIELKEIQQNKYYDIAIVAVYDYSQLLADEILTIQEAFIKQRSDLTAEFNKIELTDFKACCGQQPPEEQREKYYKLMHQINSLGAPIEGKLETK
jgi:hypothetical protein